ncbi:MAG: ribosome silencing factor [Treponema sp.]|jgi:ribosome-associated protein|nr:ribosome silencing factor [Treponema sp.]
MFQADKKGRIRPADQAPADRTALFALALGELLRNARGLDVVTLDLRGLNSWTDFFVISTVTSGAHRSGLERHIKEFAREKGFEILRRSTRPSESVENEWSLIDLGDIVVHLMTEKARLFYELERLWGAKPLELPAGTESTTSP